MTFFGPNSIMLHAMSGTANNMLDSTHGQRFCRWCGVLAARPLERPDAVIVADTDPRLLAATFAATSALGHTPVLVYSEDTVPYVNEYLTQIGARIVWVIDPQRQAPQAWRRRYDSWDTAAASLPLELARRSRTKAESVVLVGGRDPQLLVAASLLATARGAPLFPVADTVDPELRDFVRALGPTELVLVGHADWPVRPADLPEAKFTALEAGPAVLAAYEQALGEAVPEHLVVLGPSRPPAEAEPPDPAPLVAPYAVRHRAAVVIAEPNDDVERQIQRLIAERYPAVKYVTLWGSAADVPDSEVDDPVAAAGLATNLKEARFAVPPLNGLAQHQACQFRVGRITGDSLSSVSLLVARNLRRPARPSGEQPRALILANTDEELPLLETITRTTAQTFEQCRWDVRALYGWRAAWYKRPGRLWGADLVLYEGHTASLARSVHFDRDREPVHPGLYLFQGCKTLRQPEVTALLRNGAACVVGTSTNTYAASGSSLAKVYVDAMLLDQMDAGTSLMVSRNFMLALADLKERRGHEQTPKILRGGMTFGLWGDPTWMPPRADRELADTKRVRAVRKGNRIELHVPEKFQRPVEADEYRAQIPTGAKLAGMYEWDDEDHLRRQLPPLYFAVVALPDYAGPEAPSVTSPLANNRWTTLWDARNRWLYLLVQSGSKFDYDRGRSLSFHVGSSND